MGLFNKKNEIGPDTIVQRRNELLFNKIDGEVVMLSIENGEYYGMDDVGGRIWEILENPISIKKLLAILVQEYNVSYESCKKDVIPFINLLIEKKIVLC